MINYQSCPLCNSFKFNPYKVGNAESHPIILNNPHISPFIQWYICDDCEHIFSSRYFTREDFESELKKPHNNQELSGDLEVKRIVSSEIVEKITPYRNSGYWLDVGFGDGSLLLTAQEYGFNPVGLDLRTKVVDQIKLLGITAFSSDITDVSFDNKFSVVSFADSLEHVPFPKKSLEAAYNLLDDNGMLFISMPNLESIGWKLIDQQENGRHFYWDEIEHHHNFTKKRLYSLLEETGFSPVNYGVSKRYRSCMEIVCKKNTFRNSAGWNIEEIENGCI